jgi:hypothetical protein
MRWNLGEADSSPAERSCHCIDERRWRTSQ